MPLNIKNPEVERLIDEISGLTGETKTDAVRKALEERRARLAYRISGNNRGARLGGSSSWKCGRRFPRKSWAADSTAIKKRRSSAMARRAYDPGHFCDRRHPLLCTGDDFSPTDLRLA